MFSLLSCTKTSNLNDGAKSANASLNAKPNVVQCNPGYHWDYYLHKCVQDCPTGYHNDSITGACVVNGGGPNMYITYAGVQIGYYTSTHLLSFNTTTDVNTVLNQLDSDYETYNTNYENQYPNYTADQLDSMDSVNNFDDLRTYRNFEASFPGYVSERANIENIETTWINNSFTGLDPDSVDYTIDNSDNAICNNNYEVIIAGTTYQWTSNGFDVVGAGPAFVINSASGCYTNKHKKLPYYNSNNTRKGDIKVAVNNWFVRGEGKGKVVCYKKKSSGGWKRSRLDVEVNASGNIYNDNSCIGLTQVDLRKPPQGYLKRRSVKVIARFTPPDKAYYEPGQFSAGFWCNSLGFGGAVSL